MVRSLVAAMLLSTGVGAHAQTSGGPPIAFVKAGASSQAIYLSDATGSSVTKLYTGLRKATIRSIDLKPSGNEIAFKEGLTVKTLRFHDSGQPDGAAAAIPGTPCSSSQSPDYHPSGDGTFVFIAACGFGNFQVMTYKMAMRQPYGSSRSIRRTEFAGAGRANI